MHESSRVKSDMLLFILLDRARFNYVACFELKESNEVKHATIYLIGPSQIQLHTSFY